MTILVVAKSGESITATHFFSDISVGHSFQLL